MTCGVAVCVGWEVTCCTADCTGCIEAVWCWNIVWVFACSCGWTEFRTVAAEQRNRFTQDTDTTFLKVFANWPMKAVCSDAVSDVPCSPAKGNLSRFPAALAAAIAGREATLVVGKVRTARPPWPAIEPAMLSGMSSGCPRDPVWAIMPVIRVARLSWVST